MSLSLFNALQSLLCALSLLLGAYIWSTRRSPAMALFFLVTALHTILRIVDDKVFASAFSGLTFPLSYLYGSLIFIAIRELLFHSSRPWWPHFLPAAIALGLKIYGIKNPLFFGLSIAAIQFGYLWATYRLVFNYSRVSDTLHSTSPEGIIWLTRGLVLYTIIVSYQMLRYVIDPLVLEENAFIHLLFHATISIVFAIIILQIMRFPELIKALQPEDIELVASLNQPTTTSDKISAIATPDTTLSNEITSEHRHVMQRIETLMTEKKPFREPELSLNDMAELLDIPARLLSQTINLIHQCNFPEYINRARVDEAKRLLDAAEWSRRSLLEIGLEAGFNSKSSFNLMFKRISNSTPSAYRRMVRDGEIK
jgi:AraC-like DNA-binding protein